MRRYIRNEQLKCTLRQIMDSGNPEFRSIYREVLLYRTTRDDRTYKMAARMLMVPRLLMLCLVNTILLMLSGFIFHYCLSELLPSALSFVLLLAMTAFMIEEAGRMFGFLGDMRVSMRYILIDELFARRILILNKVHTAKTVKAAK